MPVAHKRLHRTAIPIALLALPGLALAGCGGGSSGSSGGGWGAKEVKIMLLTKDATNPFWQAMQKGAKDQVGKEQNVKLTLASGKKDGDEQSQVDQIEQSIARGDDRFSRIMVESRPRRGRTPRRGRRANISGGSCCRSRPSPSHSRCRPRCARSIGTRRGFGPRSSGTASWGSSAGAR